MERKVRVGVGEKVCRPRLERKLREGLESKCGLSIGENGEGEV